MFSKAKNDDVVSALKRALLEGKGAAAELAMSLETSGDAQGGGSSSGVSEPVEKTTGGTVGIFELLLMGSVPLNAFKIRAVSSTRCLLARFEKTRDRPQLNNSERKHHH